MKEVLKTVFSLALIVGVLAGVIALSAWIYDQTNKVPPVVEGTVAYHQKNMPTDCPVHWARPHPHPDVQKLEDPRLVRWDKLKGLYLEYRENSKKTWRRYDYSKVRYSTHIQDGERVLDTLWLTQKWNGMEVYFVIDEGGVGCDAENWPYFKVKTAEQVEINL